MSKKALKGLKAVRLWSIEQNDDDAYVTGAMFPLPQAQSLTKDVQSEDYDIFADDEPYLSGSNFKYEELLLTLAELTPELEAKLSGGTWNETEQTYTFKDTDLAPTFALGYAGLMLDKQYRMFKHYAATLMSVKVDHSTKDNSNNIQPYQLRFRNAQRTKDRAVRVTRDSDDGSFGWLDTIDNLS